MSGPGQTGSSPCLRPLVPGDAHQAWALLPRGLAPRCLLTCPRSSLLIALPPTQNRRLGPITSANRGHGRKDRHASPTFLPLEPQRHRAYQRTWDASSQKDEKKPGRKETASDKWLPWQRAAPGGKWWRLGFWPQEGETPPPGLAEAPHPLRGRPEQTVTQVADAGERARARSRAAADG